MLEALFDLSEALLCGKDVVNVVKIQPINKDEALLTLMCWSSIRAMKT